MAKDQYGNAMLLGPCTPASLEQPPFNAWYVNNKRAYPVDSSMPASARTAMREKNYLIFFGTWCGDSQREVPRMLKILQYYGVEPDRVKLVAVSNHTNAYKQSPGREEKGLYIHRVPTMLVYAGKKETGRIIELPVASLERDLAKIVTGEPYVPVYGEVTPIINFIEKTSPEKPANAPEHELSRWKEQVREPYNLNSVGYMLMTGMEFNRAITLFTISTRLFPADVNAYKRLAEIYASLGNKEKAAINYKRVLELQPQDADAKKALALE